VIDGNRRLREITQQRGREQEQQRREREEALAAALSCFAVQEKVSSTYPRLFSLLFCLTSQEAEILSLRSELSSAQSQLTALDLKLKSAEGWARRLEEDKVS
jgi:uncharacterized membrane protein YccC